MYYINEKTETFYRRCVIMFLIALFAMVITVLLMINTFSRAEDELRGPIPFESVISDKTAKGAVVYIDVVSQPVRAFDIRSGRYGGRQYYVVNDGKNNYAAIMSGTDAKAAGEEALQTGSSKLIGCTAALSEKTRKKINAAVPNAIDTDQMLELHVLAFTDTYHVVRERRVFVWFLAVFITAFVTAIMCLSYIASFNPGKLSYDEKLEVENEMTSPDTVWLEDIKCYACKNWLVGLGKGFHAIKYKDIAVLYRKKITYNGLKISEELLAKDKNGRTVAISLFEITDIEKNKKSRIAADMETIRLTAEKINKDIEYR